jgi:hypothetical protein
MGQVASSVSLFTNRRASNHGANTRPTGGRLRPRVSTVIVISPRRVFSFAVAPRRSPLALASSGCM